MAIATHAPATWDDILSTTFHNYRKTLTDNIFESRPLLNFYMSKGRLRTLSGGISIVEPLVYAEGDFHAYSEWDKIDVTPVKTATASGALVNTGGTGGPSGRGSMRLRARVNR